MHYSLTDVAGACGAAFIVVAYLLLQTRRLSADSLLHQLMNLLGAGLILYSLYFKPNLGAVAVEAFWLIISFYGLLRSWNERRQNSEAKSRGELEPTP